MYRARLRVLATRFCHAPHALAARARRCHATQRYLCLVAYSQRTTHGGRRLSIVLLSKPTRARASPSSSNVIDGHFVPSLLLALLEDRNEPIKRFSFPRTARLVLE